MPEIDYKPEDLMVKVSELLVATPDTTDAAIDPSVLEVLRLLRDKMNMDVVFVSEFVNGQRVLRHVDTAPGADVVKAGQSDALEASWCQRVVDGRLPEYVQDAQQLPASAELLKGLPFSIGTHISTPLVLASGEVYGTLCTFSLRPKEPPQLDDLKVLRYTAQLAARKIDERREADRRRPPPPELSLVPLEKGRF